MCDCGVDWGELYTLFEGAVGGFELGNVDTGAVVVFYLVELLQEMFAKLQGVAALAGGWC